MATISDGTVLALGAGSATVTATAGCLSAETEVTVEGGENLPFGAVRWEVVAEPGDAVGSLIRGLPDDSSNYYAVEQAFGGGQALLRALDDDGTVKQIAALPLAPSEVLLGSLGNSIGGVLLSVEDAGTGAESVLAIGADASAGWRHRFTGVATILGQNGAGVVFVYEENGNNAWITLLSGDDGHVRAQVPLPFATYRTIHIDCLDNIHSSGQSPVSPRKISIDATGAAHFLVSRSDTFFDYLPCGQGYESIDRRLELWSITDTGQTTVTPVSSYSYSGGANQRRRVLQGGRHPTAG